MEVYFLLYVKEKGFLCVMGTHDVTGIIVEYRVTHRPPKLKVFGWFP